MSNVSPAERVSAAGVWLARHPIVCVYAGLLMCGEQRVSDEVPTAGTDGWNVYYNPKFVSGLTKEELRGLVLHEQMHKAFDHMGPQFADLKEEDFPLLNMAQDYVINAEIVEVNKKLKLLLGKSDDQIKLPDGGCIDAKYLGWDTRKVYADLKKQGKSGKGQGGSGQGSMDVHMPGQPGQGQPSRADQAQQVDTALRQGEVLNQALHKKIGKGSDGMSSALGDLLHPTIPWQDLLADFIRTNCSGSDEATWSKVDRRFAAQGLYLPGSISQRLEEVVVLLDTSGSCFGGAEMQMFITELASLIEMVKPEKCHVIYCDSEVAGHQIFEDGQFAVQDMDVRGGGGTDLPVVFDYCRQNNINPQVLIGFTDGHTPWGQPPSYPVLWAISTDQKAPWGITINVK